MLTNKIFNASALHFIMCFPCFFIIKIYLIASKAVFDSKQK